MYEIIDCIVKQFLYLCYYENHCIKSYIIIDCLKQFSDVNKMSSLL
jgi:hypothetical protein